MLVNLAYDLIMQNIPFIPLDFSSAHICTGTVFITFSSIFHTFLCLFRIPIELLPCGIIFVKDI